MIAHALHEVPVLSAVVAVGELTNKIACLIIRFVHTLNIAKGCFSAPGVQETSQQWLGTVEQYT